MACFSVSAGFGVVSPLQSTLQTTYDTKAAIRAFSLFMAESDSNQDSGVIELVDDEETAENSSKGGISNAEAAVAPFLSQGELADDVLSPDLSNPKQTRVIIYIILSLLPILFLIPLMLGSREFLPAIIPMEDMPPVQL